eukprot:TRINITY_DN2470_c0_g1_i1.p2 TRINITY_DN2470_c0_g1~~TRINITY_DN2470_c0_g1_i1.p2  ORF type:complete len:212 (+),score=57.10 TRINITY_DN2470_c0_g1_i1:67-702(+)
MSDHTVFMNQALKAAQTAFNIGEVPVGCVLVKNYKVKSIGYNQTIETRNATRHAELIAIDSLLEYYKKKNKKKEMLLKDYTLYVTIEPCIMCAGALKLLGLTKCVYGASNSRFGACSTVFSIHNLGKKLNSEEMNNNNNNDDDDNYNCERTSLNTLHGDINDFEVIKGVCEEEAIMILKTFYKQENKLAPEIKRIKKNQETVTNQETNHQN